MDLKSYLAANRLSYRDFGAKIGVDHSQVSRWISGRRFPSLQMALAIEKTTDGQVMPKDLLGDNVA